MKIRFSIFGLILCVGMLLLSFAAGTKEGAPLPETPGIPSAAPAPFAHEAEVPTVYSFVQTEKNRIIDNDSTMNNFFEELYHLKTEAKDSSEVISVVHIGDSHIQAGYLTGRVMRNLQQEFGNAGRGLVVPLKLARTNEPNDYFITSTNQWSSRRIIQKNRTLPIGIGGIGLTTQSNSINFTLKLGTKNGAGYEFNQITVFSDEEAPLLDANGVIDSTSRTTQGYPFAYKLRLESTTDSIRLRSQVAKNGSAPIFYGFSLENGHSGVLYHSIGINGAHYADYINTNVFKQTQALNPQLIIVSLGTNEAFGRNFSENELKNQVELTIKKIKEENPNALLLLTTPAECYVRRIVNKKAVYEPNAKVARVRKVLTDFANENHIAYWDLYEATGGNGSSKSWFTHKLMTRDRIHFTQTGYQLQADLLYNALITGYNDYVASRN